MNSPQLSFPPVVTQYYEAEVVSEYVIRGNAAILKCTIPSFVAEFVSVDSWVGSDGSTFKPTNDYGTIPYFLHPPPCSLPSCLPKQKFKVARGNDSFPAAGPRLAVERRRQREPSQG